MTNLLAQFDLGRRKVGAYGHSCWKEIQRQVAVTVAKRLGLAAAEALVPENFPRDAPAKR